MLRLFVIWCMHCCLPQCLSSYYDWEAPKSGFCVVVKNTEINVFTVHTNVQGNGHSNCRPQGETTTNPLKEKINKIMKIHPYPKQSSIAKCAFLNKKQALCTTKGGGNCNRNLDVLNCTSRFLSLSVAVDSNIFCITILTKVFISLVSGNMSNADNLALQ